MIVLMFKPRFAPLVQSGAKRQTIRPLRKRPVKVGDVLSLREWTGLPYRSPQRILRAEETCKEVHAVMMSTNPKDLSQFLLSIDLMEIHNPYREFFARDDGFPCWAAMCDWFAQTHGFPFNGVLIKW